MSLFCLPVIRNAFLFLLAGEGANNNFIPRFFAAAGWLPGRALLPAGSMQSSSGGSLA
jgi:hypothetical protein